MIWNILTRNYKPIITYFMENKESESTGGSVFYTDYFLKSKVSRNSSCVFSLQFKNLMYACRSLIRLGLIRTEYLELM